MDDVVNFMKGMLEERDPRVFSDFTDIWDRAREWVIGHGFAYRGRRFAASDRSESLPESEIYMSAFKEGRLPPPPPPGPDEPPDSYPYHRPDIEGTEVVVNPASGQTVVMHADSPLNHRLHRIEDYDFIIVTDPASGTGRTFTANDPRFSQSKGEIFQLIKALHFKVKDAVQGIGPIVNDPPPAD